jgi:hypothetical protein
VLQDVVIRSISSKYSLASPNYLGKLENYKTERRQFTVGQLHRGDAGFTVADPYFPSKIATAQPLQGTSSCSAATMALLRNH